MIVRDPFECVGDEEVTNFIAVRVVKVQRLPPWCFIAPGEVGPELRQTIPFGPDMVVNRIEDHSQASLMTRVDKRLEAIGPAVRVLNREGKNAAIAPVSRSRKLRNRH